MENKNKIINQLQIINVFNTSKNIIEKYGISTQLFQGMPDSTKLIHDSVKCGLISEADSQEINSFTFLLEVMINNHVLVDTLVSKYYK